MEDAVNVAARLESSTREVESNLVVDDNMHSSLREGNFTLESLGEINVKRREAAVALWSIADPKVSKYLSKGEIVDMISDVTGGNRKPQAFCHVSESKLQELERGENIKDELQELGDSMSAFRSYDFQDSIRSLMTLDIFPPM